jgi:hypothetical protein
MHDNAFGREVDIEVGSCPAELKLIAIKGRPGLRRVGRSVVEKSKEHGRVGLQDMYVKPGK